MFIVWYITMCLVSLWDELVLYCHSTMDELFSPNSQQGYHIQFISTQHHVKWCISLIVFGSHIITNCTYGCSRSFLYSCLVGLLAPVRTVCLHTFRNSWWQVGGVVGGDLNENMLTAITDATSPVRKSVLCVNYVSEGVKVIVLF